MQLFLDRRYFREKEPCEDNIVDVLTANVRSCVRHGIFDEGMERQEAVFFAVNYGEKKGDGSPVMRGFLFNGKLYEIDRDSSLLIVREEAGRLYYDHDKIGDRDHIERVFEGTGEEFIEEFLKRGYKLLNKG